MYILETDEENITSKLATNVIGGHLCFPDMLPTHLRIEISYCHSTSKGCISGVFIHVSGVKCNMVWSITCCSMFCVVVLVHIV